MKTFAPPSLAADIIFGVWISVKPRWVKISRNRRHTPASKRNIAWLAGVRKSRTRLSKRVSWFTRIWRLFGSWMVRYNKINHFASNAIIFIEYSHYFSLVSMRLQVGAEVAVLPMISNKFRVLPVLDSAPYTIRFWKKQLLFSHSNRWYFLCWYYVYWRWQWKYIFW